MRKIFITSLVTTIGTFVATLQAHAICPVCTIAVGAGIGLSRWLGIDDAITGLWVGGLTVSVTMWTLDWFERKQWRFKGRGVIITIAYYLIIVVPLQFMDVLWHPFNKFLGIDKLVLGIVLGSIAFLAAAKAYDMIKRRNNNKPWFPFQKVVMPVGVLMILSALFYFLTK